MQGSLKSSSAEKMIDEYFGISDADGIVLCDTGLCGEQACSVKLRNIKVIGVDTDNIHSSAELRSVLSHELGHCKTDCFYSIGANKQERYHAEYQANKWAIKFCVPFSDYLKAIKEGATDVCALSEYFDITVDMARKVAEMYEDKLREVGDIA